MRLKILIIGMLLLAVSQLPAQYSGDVLGQHQLTVGSGSQVTGQAAQGCLYCHAPHSGFASGTALWNQKLTTTTYVPYTSSTYHQQGNAQPTLGSDSSLCLSCHDGTIAVGQTIAYGQMIMSGTVNGTDLVGGVDANNQHPLQPQHPFSVVTPLKDSPDLIASLVQGKTGDPTVNLIKGNVECTSCHDPHVENKDQVSTTFLVRDSSKGQLCVACHDSTRTVTGGAGQWQKNPLTSWTNSAHAQASNQVAANANVGSYSTVGQNACLSCHMPHNAPGPTRLTRAPNELDCVNCHGGGTNVSPAAPNVLAEYTKAGNVGHPFPQGTNVHDATEDLIGQNVVLNNNRHATCVDCHNAHSSMQVASFNNLLPPSIRPSQGAIAGVSADGTTIVNPAVNQYENCLRCHGNSSGEVANPVFGYLPTRAVATGNAFNLIPQFAASATSAASAHPVMYANGGSGPEPTLLNNMWNLTGTVQERAMGSQIFCTDCHNNDDNREFGGSSPNGPHGSRYSHILERQYVYNQALAPGQPIPSQYLYPNPDLSAVGPYALCAKCHDLTKLDQSWNQHLAHVNSGFSCSVCHTPHGMGSTATVSGQRLVNFDINVVAPNGTTPITYFYNGGNDTCSLVCHGHSHTATAAPAAGLRRR